MSGFATIESITDMLIAIYYVLQFTCRLMQVSYSCAVDEMPLFLCKHYNAVFCFLFCFSFLQNGVNKLIISIFIHRFNNTKNYYVVVFLFRLFLLMHISIKIC